MSLISDRGSRRPSFGAVMVAGAAPAAAAMLRLYACRCNVERLGYFIGVEGTRATPRRVEENLPEAYMFVAPFDCKC